MTHIDDFIGNLFFLANDDDPEGNVTNLECPNLFQGFDSMGF